MFNLFYMLQETSGLPLWEEKKLQVNENPTLIKEPEDTSYHLKVS